MGACASADPDRKSEKAMQADLNRIARDRMRSDMAGFDKHGAFRGNAEWAARNLTAETVDADTNDLGQTRLIEAASRSKLTLVETLLAKKADVDARDVTKQTALYCAQYAKADGASERSRGPDVEITRLLLDARADPDAREKNGCTSVYSAVSLIGQQFTTSGPGAQYERRKRAVEMLIDAKADVNIGKKDQIGNTPLINAVGMANAAGVSLLLAAGADVNLKNSDGLMAMDMAKGCAHRYGDPRFKYKFMAGYLAEIRAELADKGAQSPTYDKYGSNYDW